MRPTLVRLALVAAGVSVLGVGLQANAAAPGPKTFASDFLLRPMVNLLVVRGSWEPAPTLGELDALVSPIRAIAMPES